MKTKSKLKNNKGFSLLEVLITIIVISIGVFALASSQIRLLKRNDATLIENAISIQATNMFEYMLANRTVVAEYIGTYDLTHGAITNHGSAVSVIEDTTAWTTALFNLGVSRAVISQVNGENNVYNITVTYNNNGAWGKSSTTTDVNYTASLGGVR